VNWVLRLAGNPEAGLLAKGFRRALDFEDDGGGNRIAEGRGQLAQDQTPGLVGEWDGLPWINIP